MASIQQANPILARLKADGQTTIGSLDEFLEWVFSSKENLLKVLPERNTAWIAERTGIPEKLVRAIVYSRQFVQALFDELHFRKFNIPQWEAIYDSIIPQLLDEKTPLGAKRSMLEFLTRQMGLEKPRKLSVKQQSEVVVRIEPTRPNEVLEVLGVPVEQVPQLANENPVPGGKLGDFMGGSTEDAEYVPVASDDG